MGDRCCMSVRCLKKDAARFREIGFDVEHDLGPVVDMQDIEANYAHAGEMPNDIPYVASHGRGDCYDAGRLVCDGKEFVEQKVGEDEGYVIDFNEFGDPNIEDIAKVRKLIKMRTHISEMFQAMIKSAIAEIQ